MHPANECAHGALCIVLGALAYVWQDVTPYIAGAAGLLGFFLGIHGTWRVVCRCVRLFKRHGWKALLDPPEEFENPDAPEVAEHHHEKAE